MPNLDYLVLPLATSLKVTDKLSINTGLSTAVLLTGLFTNHSNEDAITVDVVSGNIRADVDVMSQCLHMWIAGVRDADQRAGFGIALAETHEVQGVGLGQDRQIGL